MHYADLLSVPSTVERAIIINVSTEVISSVAIASALRHAGMPILVVNCTDNPVSKVLMGELSRQWGFDLVDLRLASHGTTLDRLFTEVYADRILLLDSDAELLSPLVTAQMRMAFNDGDVYGSGWIQPSSWLSREEVGLDLDGVTPPVLYHERPWIPCSMFRTSFVRKGLAQGSTFLEVHNLGNSSDHLEPPAALRAQAAPFVIHKDTGGQLHYWAVTHGLRFVGGSVFEMQANQVSHHHGVTRMALHALGGNGTHASEVEASALQRLRFDYEPLWAGFAAAVEAAQVVGAHN